MKFYIKKKLTLKQFKEIKNKRKQEEFWLSKKERKEFTQNLIKFKRKSKWDHKKIPNIEKNLQRLEERLNALGPDAEIIIRG